MSGARIVTGRSRGIGATVSRLAARDGWDVCVNYVTHQAHALSSEADVLRLFENCEARIGRIGGLVRQPNA